LPAVSYCSALLLVRIISSVRSLWSEYLSWRQWNSHCWSSYQEMSNNKLRTQYDLF
jgi:hypothetical protein